MDWPYAACLASKSNNQCGLDILLDHLIQHHGYRKLAFIAGPVANQEARARYEAYRDALQRHNIAFDPNLVAQGTFARRSGNAALEQLLARAGKPDVVVAANDLMALGAITALHEHGVHVSRDVAVTGFDDLVVSRLGDPPLTTVAQPIDGMVELAIKLVLQQLAGQDVPHLTELASQFVVRQSCGCCDADCATVGVITPRILDGSRASIAARAVQLLRTTQAAGDAAGSGGTDTDRLLAALQLEFSDRPQSFSAALESLLSQMDLPTLTAALSGALLALGIQHAYVSRYPDAIQTELECFVSVRDGAPYYPPNPRFLAEELMPCGVFPQDRRSTFFAFPLTFDALHLGAAVFEGRSGVGGYQMVCDQISAALRSIALHQEILEQTKLHERRIQEQDREATTKRIQSLSLLAGGVAHDLNNVLGPLVALPDVIIEQLNQLSAPLGTTCVEIQADIETIKVAALRATQTIKDLLTLGRQGHVAKEPLELNRVISRYLSADALRLSRESAQVSLELCTEPLFIVASESHLGRAVTNLVRNALEAIDPHGRVVVRTESVVLSEPTAGYETIDPGSYAVVSVYDSGRGIAPHDISRLFEPFFSSKRLNDHSGSGLGLSIVHGVVKEHGGFVNVQSAADCGTTFTLYLPRAAEVRIRSMRLSHAPRGSAKVLVVDDEPVQLRTC